MSELAITHFRQAKGFVRAGDSARAVELLEKARVLARGDAELLARILEQLAESYNAVGRFEQASRCREQLARMTPQASSAMAPFPSRRQHSHFLPWIIGGAVAVGLFILAAVGVTVFYMFRSDLRPMQSPVVFVPAVRPPAPLMVLPSAAPAPATQPAAPKKIAAPTPASVPPAVAALPPPKFDRQDMLKDTVGLVVVIVHYKGPVGGGNAELDLPLGTGTAFAVGSSGLMVTNKHVVEAEKEVKIPATLEQARLPTVTYRGTTFVVCFGSDPKDRYVAKVLHKSEQCDMALLKIDHHFDHPLTIASKELRQGDDILVCGYPGAVMEALNQASNSPARIIDVSRKWTTTHKVDAFDDFSAECYNSTLTKGIVSAPERNFQGVGYMQMDAVIGPGNSGGPVVNLDNEVVGIATFGLRSPASSGGSNASYNFALLVGQLVPELTPYLKD